MKNYIKMSLLVWFACGVASSAFGHTWNIRNGTNTQLDVQLNVTGQVQRKVIPAGASVLFTYNNPLCLTTIYVMPFGSSGLVRVLPKPGEDVTTTMYNFCHNSNFLITQDPKNKSMHYELDKG